MSDITTFEGLRSTLILNIEFFRLVQNMNPPLSVPLSHLTIFSRTKIGGPERGSEKGPEIRPEGDQHGGPERVVHETNGSLK